MRHQVWRSLRRVAFGAAWGVVPVALLVGCADQSGSSSVPTLDSDDWVIVTYADTEDRFDGSVMDALLDTELAADAALQDAGAGSIDGNEIGENQYDLYFIGEDRETMWHILEPVFAAAPLPWSRAELRDGLEDTSPQVITQ